MIRLMKGICIAGLIILAYIIAGADAWAVDLEQGIADRGFQVLDAIAEIIGVRNFISMLIVNMLIRAYRARRYREVDEILHALKRNAFYIGIGMILLTTDLSNAQEWEWPDLLVFIQTLIAAPFITYFGSRWLYEIVRILLIWRISNIKEKGGQAKGWLKLYFFVDPAPPTIKVKNGNGKKSPMEIPPDAELTRLNDTWIRAPGDKPMPAGDDNTQFLDPSNRAGENYDPDKTPTPK